MIVLIKIQYAFILLFQIICAKRAELIKAHSNPSGIILTQSRTQQIMLEEGLMFAMMIKLKGGSLDHSFFRNQREPGMTTK